MSRADKEIQLLQLKRKLEDERELQAVDSELDFYIDEINAQLTALQTRGDNNTPGLTDSLIMALVGKSVAKAQKRLGVHSKEVARNIGKLKQSTLSKSASKAGLDYKELKTYITESVKEKGGLTPAIKKQMAKRERRVAELTKMVAKGYDKDKAVAEIKKLVDYEKYMVKRHIMTESAKVYNETVQNLAKADGVKKLRWVIEVSACDECRPLANKILDIDSPDLPPVHPYCRCTVWPVEDLGD